MVPPASSLRSHVSWAFAGNSIYAAGQWAILSLFAKLGGSEMLGQYALAVAIVSPILMLSHLNLRAVLATDMGKQHPFGDYLTVRLGATGIGLAAIAALAFGHSPILAGTIVGAGLAQSAENISDIYYGAMQRRERMDRIAISMIARAVVSVAAVATALALTGSILFAVGALAVARAAVLLAYDRPSGAAGEALAGDGYRAQISIVRTALPLGIVLMLASLNANLPRYAIEHYLSLAQLGGFAAAASFVTIGGTVVNAMGQAATPRLARYFEERNWHEFHRLALRLTALALALGAAGVLVALGLGRLLLRVVYRPEFEQYTGILTATMAAGVVGYAASMLGYVVTSARAFDPQLPLFCAVAAACGAAAWILVPRLGLAGAPAALGVAAVLQVSGEVLILRRAIARRRLAA